MDSSIIQIIIQTTVGSLIGYIFMVIRELKAKLDRAVDLDQVKELLQGKLEIVDVKSESLSTDVRNIETTLNRLEEKLDRLILK